ncbi:MAG: Maf-like protein [Alphaproteobacteria bacterium]|nr:MAG: Maf-like protein [Alphaproteobacteria bacterium]
MTPDRTAPPLVLASRSPYRAEMLHKAGLAFDTAAADLDERAVEAPLLGSGADAADIAEVLARAKAENVAQTFPGRHVIGCDQTLSLDGRVLHKPVDMEEARRRLLALSGRQHQLNSAVCLVRDGSTVWSHVEVCAIRFRRLDPGFVGRHLAAVGTAALSSVGAYQIEGRGIQLVESIDGDFFAVIGLPLLPLLTALRRLDLIDH